MKGIVTVALMVSGAAQAGPFGLEMGTPVDKLRASTNLKPGKQPHVYDTKTVPQKHPRFKDFTLVITPDHGLCKIIAFSGPISTSVYGDELRAEFDSLEQSLDKKYGTHERIDFLRRDSIWKDPRDWTMALLQRERSLLTFWKENNEKPLGEGIATVSLEAIAVQQSMAMIKLSYDSVNVRACLEEVNEGKDDAL